MWGGSVFGVTCLWSGCVWVMVWDPHIGTSALEYTQELMSRTFDPWTTIKWVMWVLLVTTFFHFMLWSYPVLVGQRKRVKLCFFWICAQTVGRRPMHLLGQIEMHTRHRGHRINLRFKPQDWNVFASASTNNPFTPCFSFLHCRASEEMVIYVLSTVQIYWSIKASTVEKAKSKYLPSSGWQFEKKYTYIKACHQSVFLYAHSRMF